MAVETHDGKLARLRPLRSKASFRAAGLLLLGSLLGSCATRASEKAREEQGGESVTGASTEPAARTPGLPDACALSVVGMPDPTCAACALSWCCPEFQACEANPDCLAVLQCRADCRDDFNCQQSCAAEHAPGAVHDDAITACLESRCPSDCVGAASENVPVCTSGFFVSSQSCADCLGVNCCDEFSACFQEQDCRFCLLGGERDAPECAGASDDATGACAARACADSCG